jgi:hypothetical protein
MQNLPRLDRLPEPIVRGRFIGFSKPELFRVWKKPRGQSRRAALAKPEQRLRPSRRIFAKNADWLFRVLGFDCYFMAPRSPQKRKRRRIQLRDAQRRRRARLKTESKSFLQIILTKETLELLRKRSEAEGKPLHICATEILESGLIGGPEDQQREEPDKTAVDHVEEEPQEVTPITDIAEAVTGESVTAPNNQMELFA